MKTAVEQGLYAGMKFEHEREGPPPGFPGLPMIPVGRCTSTVRVVRSAESRIRHSHRTLDKCLAR